jgi:hypothetical protein
VLLELLQDPLVRAVDLAEPAARTLSRFRLVFALLSISLSA